MDHKNCCECHNTGVIERNVTEENIQIALSWTQDYYDKALQKARSCFDEMMTKADDLEEYLTEWIDEARDKYEESVAEIWEAFKDNLKKGRFMQSGVFELQPTIEEAMDKFIHAADHIFEESGDQEEFDAALDKVLDEYLEWGKLLFHMFDGALRELTEEDEAEKNKNHEEKLVDWAVKNHSTIKALGHLMQMIQNPNAKAEQGKSKASQQEPKSSKSKKSKKKEKVRARKMEKEMQSSATGKPHEQKKDKGMDQGQKVEKQAAKQEEEDDDDCLPELVEMEEEVVEENQSTQGSITNNEGKGVGQPLGNLEKTMAEMLNTAKEMNDSLISLQKKQEQQEKCFFASLEKKLNDLRIEQVKKIESAMGQMKKKSIKK